VHAFIETMQEKNQGSILKSWRVFLKVVRNKGLPKAIFAAPRMVDRWSWFSIMNLL
jgi:hypothetical protein